MRKKTVIHIPKLRVCQYLLLFNICYYLKISLNISLDFNKDLIEFHACSKPLLTSNLMPFISFCPHPFFKPLLVHATISETLPDTKMIILFFSVTLH